MDLEMRGEESEAVGRDFFGNEDFGTGVDEGRGVRR